MRFLPFLFMVACFPADEILDLDHGREIRLHCEPDCPAHDDIRTALRLVDVQIGPFLEYDPYTRWQHYAHTYHTEPMYYRDQRILGITLHNRRAVGIWYPYECDGPRGVCAGVLGWELMLVAVEKTIPLSGEAEKLRWLSDRGIENMDWGLEDF